MLVRGVGGSISDLKGYPYFSLVLLLGFVTTHAICMSHDATQHSPFFSSGS